MSVGVGEVTALGATATGVIGAVFAGVRGMRSDKANEDEKQQAIIMAGYAGLMEAQQKDNQRLREELAVERKEWTKERSLMSADVRTARQQADEACQRAERAEQTARECLTELESLRRELTETKHQRDELAEENTVLRAKVARLEERVQELERHGGTGRTPPDGTPAVR